MKTIRSKVIAPDGIAHDCVTYTGEGGGQITFQAGNPRPVVTPAPVPDHDDTPGTKEAGRIGAKWKPHWENYGKELATRDEGCRGLPIDYQPPDHKALGIRDHKEATAARMMEALHQGDADYFKGLVKALEAYEKNNGREKILAHSDIAKRRCDTLESIRQAATETGGIPSVERIKNLNGNSRSDNKDFRKDSLIPIGFGWIPMNPKGRPKK
jgi:hypothetical protein